MVVKVVGTIDGRDVIFNQNQATGRWETIIPPDLDGTYVVDLWAYNDEGNVGYAATVLFTIDLTNLICIITLLKYILRPVDRDLALLPIAPPLIRGFKMSNYKIGPLLGIYELRSLNTMCEYYFISIPKDYYLREVGGYGLRLR